MAALQAEEAAHSVLSNVANRQVWLKSLWGFDPGNWGCIGYSTEELRQSFLSRAQPGALVAVYVTKGHGPKELRGMVAGIMEVSTRFGDAREYVSETWMASNDSSESTRGRWRFAAEAVRAWKIIPEERDLVETMFPDTYSRSKARIIGARGLLVSEREASALLARTVVEIPVFGQTAGVPAEMQPLGRALVPSNAVPPAKRAYWVREPNGPKHLYVLRLDGNISHYLGREATFEGKMIIKVGYSRSPITRCAQLQSAYPAGKFHWAILKPDPIPNDPPFPSAEVAIAGEDAMKAKLMELDPSSSLGGEFFLVDETMIKSAWDAGRIAADIRSNNRASRGVSDLGVKNAVVGGTIPAP